MDTLTFSSKLGLLQITFENEYVTNLKFADNNAKVSLRATSFQRKIITQVQEYLEGSSHELNFEISPSGSEFQKKVWKALENIPFGETLSYGEVAKKVGGLNYSRAVGGACNKNPILFRIPCHRVLARNGLGGFLLGKSVKEKLLHLETL